MSSAFQVAPAVLSLIGNTPLVQTSRLDAGCCELFLKLENQNPGGSIKDRIARSMVEAAEAQGLLKPGATLIEATAGNTGLGLALVARAKGYNVTLVVPDKMSPEKVTHLRALGADVRLTRSDVDKGHPAYYQDMAARLAEETPNSWFVDQFNNPSNPLAHYYGTGPEIWAQMAEDVDAVVVGVGSGGTLGGLTAFFKEVAPHVEIVLADPAGSILADYVETGTFGAAGSWAVEGIGEDFIPAIADFSLVRTAYRIPDQESFAAARELLAKEGITAGSSSGTLLAAALRYCRAQTTPKRVVTLVCDTGTRYLSKLFNEPWLQSEGLIDRPALGDLRRFIARPQASAHLVSISPDDNIKTAFARMRAYEVSQLPILQNGVLLGLLEEADVLQATLEAGHYRNVASVRVTEHMRPPRRLLRSDASVAELLALLTNGVVCIVGPDNHFHGFITPLDVLNVLRHTD